MELFLVPSGQTMQVFSGHTGPVQAGTFTQTGSGYSRHLRMVRSFFGILALPHLYGNLCRGRPFGMANGITSLAVNAAGTVAVVGGANGEVPRNQYQ